MARHCSHVVTRRFLHETHLFQAYVTDQVPVAVVMIDLTWVPCEQLACTRCC